MKVTLQVDGKEKTFSEDELVSIVKEYLAQKQAATHGEETPIQRPMRPTEGVPFEVNPLVIDRTPFQEGRKDQMQEETRQLILKAFAMVDENPTRYGNPFKTLMPEKTWDEKTYDELRKLATDLGDHMADWVELALVWAQQIYNGEPWKNLCDSSDLAKWFRLVDWGNGCYGIVGGARRAGCPAPATIVLCKDRDRVRKTQSAVPLVVLYK